jgi:hypothetical protein
VVTPIQAAQPHAGCVDAQLRSDDLDPAARGRRHPHRGSTVIGPKPADTAQLRSQARAPTPAGPARMRAKPEPEIKDLTDLVDGERPLSAAGRLRQ